MSWQETEIDIYLDLLNGNVYFLDTIRFRDLSFVEILRDRREKSETTDQ